MENKTDGSLYYKEDSDIKSNKNLDMLLAGETAMVINIPSIELLPLLGIRIGKSLKVIAKCLANGPFIVDVDKRTIVIDREIAKKISIERLDVCEIG